jgi:hypothetical protein
MKTRMTAADVAAEVACLQAAGLHGMRVSNVYDLNARSYILKLSRSAGDGLQGQKVCPRSRSLVATIHPRAGSAGIVRWAVNGRLRMRPDYAVLRELRACVVDRACMPPAARPAPNPNPDEGDSGAVAAGECVAAPYNTVRPRQECHAIQLHHEAAQAPAWAAAGVHRSSGHGPGVCSPPHASHPITLAVWITPSPSAVTLGSQRYPQVRAGGSGRLG